jgi:hypothetical protein
VIKLSCDQGFGSFQYFDIVFTPNSRAISALRPVDASQIVIDDAVFKRRVQDYCLKEYFIRYKHMIEEAHEIGVLPHERIYIDYAVPCETPIAGTGEDLVMAREFRIFEKQPCD